MGRKVYITSDMSIDDRLIEVAEEDEMAAAMWPWFLTALDDWGRCLANPKSLKNKVFQLFPSMDAEAIERALQLYANAGLIRLYEVDGRRYAAVPAAKWWKYQTHIRKDKRQKDDSRYPAPPSDVDAQEQDGAETDAESDAQLRADAREDAESRANARTSPPSPTPTTLPPYYTSLTDSSGSGGSNAPANESSEKDQVVNEAVRWGFDVTPALTAELENLAAEFGTDWVIEAIGVAGEAGKPTLAYVRGVLRNWKQNGGITREKPKPVKERKQTRKSVNSYVSDELREEWNRFVEEQEEWLDLAFQGWQENKTPESGKGRDKAPEPEPSESQEPKHEPLKEGSGGGGGTREPGSKKAQVDGNRRPTPGDSDEEADLVQLAVSLGCNEPQVLIASEVMSLARQYGKALVARMIRALAQEGKLTMVGLRTNLEWLARESKKESAS